MLREVDGPYPQRKYIVLQPLLQHCEELEQCIPVATHVRPFGTPASMLSELTAPVVICTLSAADSVLAAEDELALRASRIASKAAIVCIGLMLVMAPALAEKLCETLFTNFADVNRHSHPDKCG